MAVTVSIVKKRIEEMEQLSSKPPPTKRKKTCDVDESHWETGQRTSEDTTTLGMGN